MYSIKQLLNRDEEVMYSETPTRKQALIGFLIGFVGYMYLFPILIMQIFIKIYDLTKDSPAELIQKYSLLSQIIAGVLVLAVMIFAISFPKIKNAIKNFDKRTFILGLKYFLISYLCVMVWNMIYMLFGGDISDNANQEGLNSMFTNMPFP